MSFTFQDMSEFLAQRQTAIQKRPERLEVVDALPMTASGKVQKHLLRAEIAEKLRRERSSGEIEPQAGLQSGSA